MDNVRPRLSQDDTRELKRLTAEALRLNADAQTHVLRPPSRDSESSDDLDENPFGDEGRLSNLDISDASSDYLSPADLVPPEDDPQELRRQLQETKIQLALEQSRQPALYDDTYFTDRFKELRYHIRNWAMTHFSHSGGYFTPRAQRRFRGLSPDWATYLNSSYWRPWLIQARVWDKLQRHVFDTNSKARPEYVFVATEEGHFRLDQELAQAVQFGSADSRRAYRQWRTSTFTILFPGKGKDIDPPHFMKGELYNRIKRLRTMIWKSIRVYADRRENEKRRKNPASELWDILESAIVLDLDIKKHTADISLSFAKHKPGIEFDGSRMDEAVARDAEKYVDLMLSPPLYKEEDLPDGTVERRQLMKAEVSTSSVSKARQNMLGRAIERVYTPESHQSEGAPRAHAPMHSQKSYESSAKLQKRKSSDDSRRYDSRTSTLQTSR
ncbi:hypothetical protein BDV96DRAFT_652418 [Lophiotrema nucula]|uniref:Uncharacterized protein n=1 Tax=Lophiotrema nucula TaxID=690887 RepID=A0A6A5YQ21_9PLEO|nr:hypothetical protein BDV96DRAFT_652418 [Lophiotrema nucula]